MDERDPFGVVSKHWLGRHHDHMGPGQHSRKQHKELRAVYNSTKRATRGATDEAANSAYVQSYESYKQKHPVGFLADRMAAEMSRQQRAKAEAWNSQYPDRAQQLPDVYKPKAERRAEQAAWDAKANFGSTPQGRKLVRAQSRAHAGWSPRYARKRAAEQKAKRMAKGFDPFEVSKADRPAPPKGYRNSYLAPINPRSRTYVKEGTGVNRGFRFVGGSMVGGMGGSAAGLGLSAATRGKVDPGIASQYGGLLGTAVGGSIGRRGNIKSGDTRAYLRSDKDRKRPATGALSVPHVGHFWMYGDKKRPKS